MVEKGKFETKNLGLAIKVGSKLHGCMFPGSLLPHLDNDQWKCTMFTNEFYISAHHFDKILQGNVSAV